MARKKSQILPEPSPRAGVRQRKIARHRSFKLTKKRLIKQRQPLPPPGRLLKEPAGLLRRHKRPYLGMTLLYAGLVFVLAKGLGSAFDIVDTKREVEEFVGDGGNRLETSYALFNYLLGSFNGQVSEVAGTYQLFITIIVILATIWLTRQLLNGQKTTLKDSLYKGMYPLVPFILVLVVISLQLLPALAGNFIFSTVITTGLAVTFLEKVLWFLLFIGLALLSLYMVLSSIFALQIVTLPDVTPLQALRSARELVLHRRLGIFARLIVVPLLALAASLVIFIPLIMFLPAAVEPLFLLYSSFLVVFMTVYAYNFYRHLL